MGLGPGTANLKSQTSPLSAMTFALTQASRAARTRAELQQLANSCISMTCRHHMALAAA